MSGILSLVLGLAGGYVPDGILRSPNNMVADNDPSPFVVSASSELGLHNEEYHAFDGDVGAFIYWVSSNGSLPEWIKVDLGTAQYCASYKIQARNPTFHYWSAWALEGSNNDSSWTAVDSRTGQSFTNGEVKTYTPATPMQFRYWRWTISNSQSGTHAEVDELQIYS